MLISIKDYAAKHSRTADTARQRAQRGVFKTAVKMGRDWFIEENEPWIDNRKKVSDEIAEVNSESK